MIGTGNVLNDEINDFEAGIDDSCAHRRDRLATLNSLQEGTAEGKRGEKEREKRKGVSALSWLRDD